VPANQSTEGEVLRNLKFLLCAVSALALTMGVAACGDDDDDSGDSAATTTETASAETIDVVGTDYAFDVSADPTADTTEITFTNEGEEEHDLIFAKINEGYTLDEAFEAQGREGTAEDLGATFAKPGETAKPIELKKPLEPGTYGMVCTLETKDGELHYDLGMQREFTIE
jgi:plastocyanin